MKIHGWLTANQALVLVAVVIVVTMLSRGGALASKALSNVADVTLNQVLWQENAAWRTPASLKLAAELHTHLPSKCLAAPSPEGGNRQAAQYLALAIRSRRHHCPVQTANWLLRAAESPQLVVEPLAIPGDVDIGASGDLLLNYGSARWQFRHDSGPGQIDVLASDYQLLSIPNASGSRETVVLSWHGVAQLGAWRTLCIRLRGSPGLLFTLESHSHDGVHRYVNYQEVSGDWAEYRVPLKGDYIEYLYFTFKEDEPQTDAPLHQAILGSVVLDAD